MKLAAIILLLAFPVWAAEDAPKRASRVSPGFVVTEPGWFFTDEGKQRIDERLQKDAQDIAQSKADKDACEQVPALTWAGGAVLVGIGVGAGILIAGAVMALAKR